MKFEIGDTVKVKENAHEIVRNLFFNPEMKQYEGQEYSICGIFKTFYQLKNVLCGEEKNDYWSWHEDWLEPVEEIVIDEDELKSILF